MEIAEWWPELGDATRTWLIAHNGEALPADVLAEIAAAGGIPASGAKWVGESGPDGTYLSDSATDWIEETANDEH